MRSWAGINYLQGYQSYSSSGSSYLPPPQGKQLFDWNTLIWDPLKKIADKLLNIVPNLIEAAYVLLTGWIMAHIIQFVIRKILILIRFDKIAKKTGIVALLKDVRVTMSPSVWFSKFAYWVVMISAILAALDELNFTGATFQIDQLAVFVFTIFGILLIFLTGLFMSIIVGRIVHTTTKNLRVKNANTYATAVRWTILVLTFILILRRLTVPMEFILIPIAALFVTLCITFIIAFGAGGSGWAAKVLDRLLKE